MYNIDESNSHPINVNGKWAIKRFGKISKGTLRSKDSAIAIAAFEVAEYDFADILFNMGQVSIH